MTIEEKNMLFHWNYFLAFDADAEILSRYIEFTNDNYKTYSIELIRLFLDAASEVDVVSKLLCSKVNHNINDEKENRYDIIRKNYPGIKDMKIEIPRYGIILSPWKNWKNNEKENKIPDWWNAYNNVKHHRDSRFKEGNLINTLNCISGLFCLLLYYYRDEAENGTLRPHPNLFSVAGEFGGGFDIDESGFFKFYKL